MAKPCKLRSATACASNRLLRCVVAGAVAVALAAPALAAVAEETHWFAMAAETGAQVGYARVEVRQSPAGAERIEYQETTLREQDARPTRVTGRTVVRTDPSGRTLSIIGESAVGASRTRVEVRPDGDRIEVIRQAAGGLSAFTVAGGPDVQFDNGEALIGRWDRRATPVLEFRAFSMDSLAVERIVLTPVDATRTDAGDITVLRASYDGDQLRGVQRLTLAADGRVLAITQPMYGTFITIRPTDRATAMGPRAPFRLMTSAMMKSPFRIPAGAAQGHIRYRFGFRDGMAFDLPQTGEQRVRREGGAVVIDICEACGPGLAADEASLTRARRPSEWLQSDDPRIVAAVAPVAAMAVSDARKMEILTGKARSYLGEIDFAGHFSASETLDRRRGDCTEAAVLLAAFARAAGVPARTASGYVYSRERYHGVSNVFMPHSWTVAFVDGRWRSYDAALNEFDTTHIALTIGDGDTRSMAASGQLASLLTWEAMTEVRRRPAS